MCLQEKLLEVRKILVDCGVTEYDGKSTARTIGRLVGIHADGVYDISFLYLSTKTSFLCQHSGHFHVV